MDSWVTKEVDSRIAALLKGLQRISMTKTEFRPFITLAREFGCQGYEAAVHLVDKLNRRTEDEPRWAIYDRDLIEKVAREHNLDDYLLKGMTTRRRTALEQFLSGMILHIPSQEELFRRMTRVIRLLALHGRSVIVGRGGVFLCRELTSGFHVHITAPFEWRLGRLRADRGTRLDPTALKSELFENDRQRRQFYKQHLGADVCETPHFDMVLNNSKFTPMQIAEQVVFAMERRGMPVS